MVTELGAASVPVILVITITGYILCLFLAELSAMMPDRSGGSPPSPGRRESRRSSGLCTSPKSSAPIRCLKTQ